MDNQYAAAIPAPQDMDAWNEAEVNEESAGHGSMMEKAFVLVLLLAGAAAYFIYQAGYMYIALIAVGTPLALGWFVEPRIGIYAYCFWQAWDAAIVFGDVREGAWITPAKLLSLGVLVISAGHIWRHPMRVEASRGVLFWAGLLCGVALLSTLWAWEQFASLRYGSQMLVQLLMVVIGAVMISHDMAHVRRLALWTVVGGATAAGFIVVFGQAVSAWDRATLSDQANPVSAAEGLVLAICCATLLFSLTRSRLLRLLVVAAAILMLVGIVETGTRAALGGILTGFGGAAVLTRGSGRFKRIVFLTVALGIGYGIGAMMVYSSMLKESTATRLAEFMQLPLPKQTSRFVGRDTGVRQHVWGMALEGYQRSGLMGAGIGGSVFATGRATGIYKDVHSNLLGALVELGPLGLIAFLGLHVAMLVQNFRMRDRRLQVPAWVILFSTFTIGLAHTTYTAKCFWLPILYLAVLYEVDARFSPGADELETHVPEGWR